MADAELLIGSLESAYLRVRPSSRSGGDDYWDGNWISASIDLAAGAFRGRFSASLRTDEFARFRSELEPLYETLDGTAEFHSMETWLSIQVNGDGRGHFDVQCEARDEPGTGSVLRFGLELDQTQLPGIVRSLKAIENAFPVVGTPEEI